MEDLPAAQADRMEGDALRAPRPRRGRGRSAMRRAGRAGIAIAFAMLVLAGLLGLGVLSLTGKPISLPVWAVTEVEARANAALARDMPDIAVAIGGVELRIDPDWTPRLRVEDLNVLKAGGKSLVALPDIQLVFDPTAFITSGTLRPKTLRVIGGRFALKRAADGTFDIRLGSEGAAPQVRGLTDLLTLVDRSIAAPFLSRLRLVEAEATTVQLRDDMTNRVWTVGDGRVRLDIRAEDLAAEVSVSLAGGSAGPAQAVVTMIRPKGEQRLRVIAAVDQVAAADIASAAPILGWLRVINAPISGRIVGEVSDVGLESLDAEMGLGAGALQPSPTARAVPFERASLRLGYQPSDGRIVLSNLSVESQSLRLRAKGQSYPLDAEGRILRGALGQLLPSAFLGQVQIDEVQVDPEGLFERPLRFTQGAMDARLTLNPFRLEIGQLALTEERNRKLTLSGKAEIQDAGWLAAMDVSLDAIAHDRLLQLWPKELVPKTREWLGENVAKGLLTNVHAGIRIAPKAEPKIALGYEFDDAEVRIIRTLPPVRDGSGWSVMEGKTYLISLAGGKVDAPLGGEIDVAGSVFKVPDVTEKPARAEVNLRTTSSISAALSLLDLPPFGFMTKAGRPADLADGRAEVVTRLSLPMQRRILLEDVDYEVTGTLTEVTSDQLISGKRVEADQLDLHADPDGLTIAGPARSGAAVFDVVFHQGFGPEAKGRATVEGTAELTDAGLREFGVTLPQGMFSGRTLASFDLALIKDRAPRLTLSSDLAGAALRIDAIGWSLATGTKGNLDLEAELGAVPKVTRLALSGAGLSAEGRVDLRAGGALEKASFSKLRISDWFDGSAELRGRGAGKTPDVAILGGTFDLRRFDTPKSSRSAASEAPGLDVRLDRLIVTDSIALTGFQGKFGLRGGFNGAFRSDLNGAAPVSGDVVPSRNGTAVRLVSPDAGRALNAAGVFSSAKGGTLEVRLTPRAEDGVYDGQATILDVRVRKTSALAELLSAISVVGLLEQLNGTGIHFGEARFDLVLTPRAVQITNGSAVGASMGVTLAGIYATQTKQLALQGVLSPIYVVNGLGAALTRRGEGMFGFNYSLTGTSDNPDVQVNPLSIFTPGMFRELFRRPPPVLGQRDQ